MKDCVKLVFVGLSLKVISLNYFILIKNSRKMMVYMLDFLMIIMRMNWYKIRDIDINYIWVFVWLGCWVSIILFVFLMIMILIVYLCI